MLFLKKSWLQKALFKIFFGIYSYSKNARRHIKATKILSTIISVSKLSKEKRKYAQGRFFKNFIGLQEHCPSHDTIS
jgi:hypothetical protein